MIAELSLRFLIGGLIVSAFAMIGGALKPKSFAGLFGAAPSVALATLILTVFEKGKPYAAIEARSMILGGVAFLLYACLVCRLLMRTKTPVLMTAAASLLVWLVCAIGLKLVVLG
ncbi:MAG: DUF3147 family protein [Gaiellaceae bacterium]